LIPKVALFAYDGSAAAWQVSNLALEQTWKIRSKTT
jgi:hypothetical protein